MLHARIVYTARTHLSTFKAQAVASKLTFWAYATFSVGDEVLMAAFAQYVMQNGFLFTFRARNVANMAWAFASVCSVCDAERVSVYLQGCSQ